MTKSIRAVALILLAAQAGVASAQPTTGGPPPPMDPEVPPTETPAEPLVAPTPPPPPTPPPAPTPAPAPRADRPEGTSIGIGLGYVLPTSIQTPNTTSVRLRLASGLTFEPTITVGNQKEETDNGTTSSSDTRTEFSLGTLVRIPVIHHGKVELEILGGAGLSVLKTNPDGADNNTTATSFGIGWGLAVTYWLTQHWNLSLNATNPLVAYTKSSRQQPTPLDDTSSSATTVAASFDPTVSIMIHLFN